MKKFLLWIICICIIFSNVPCFADGNVITVTIDSQQVRMKTPPIYKDGVLLVPIVEIMEKLGAFIEWNEQKQQYDGNRKGVDFVIPMEQCKACIDSVWIELDAKTQKINDVAMISSYFIECLYGIEVKKTDDTYAIAINKDKDVTYEKWSWDKVKKTLPEGEKEVDAQTFLDKYFLSAKEDLMNAKVVDVENMDFKQAVEIETVKQPTNLYDAKISVSPIGAIRKGDVAVLTFYARKIKGTHESGNAFTQAIVEQNFGGWGKALMQDVTITSDWQQFVLPLYDPNKDLDLGKYELNFRAGYKPQTIQIADVNLINYKSDVPVSVIAPNKVTTSYKGMEDDALWRKEALRRIEKYRKDNMQVSVVDANGNPISDAKVTADMTRNEFLFGTAADIQLLKTHGRDGIYQKYIKKYFNAITPESTMKWPLLIQNQCTCPVKLANWAIDNDMYMRGHNIMWDSKTFLPPEVVRNFEKMTADEIQDVIKKHITEIVKLMGDSVCQWDALNEPCFNNLLRSTYGYDFAAEWFKTAKAALNGKDVKLYVNETSITGQDQDESSLNQLIDIVEKLKESGAPIDGIGIEDHCGSTAYPQTFYNQLDKAAQCVDEVTVTEYDLETSNDIIAADYLRDQLILAYSHPKCKGFMMWGFTDKYHWFNNAPLMDKFYNLKPAAAEYEKLVLNDWVTHEHGNTDKSGMYTFRGYRGDYNISVTIDGHTQQIKCCLKKDVPNKVTCVYDGKNLSLTATNLPKQREKINYDKFKNERDDYQKLDDINEQILDIKANDGTEVSSLTDQNDETFWTFNNKNDFIVLHIKPQDSILKFNWNFGKAYQYDVYVSDDQVNWQKAEGCADNQFKLKNHEWVKIVNNSNCQISLSEITVN